MVTNAIDIQSVSHAYGAREALREISLEVEPGILLGLLGPNGGGKTTLFRVISTLLRPTSGTALVFGHDTMREADAVRRRIGMVFQHAALDDELSIRENAFTSAALYRLTGDPLVRRFEHLSDAFGIADRSEQRVRTLSGGLKRRADLLRGLLHSPDLLLLDEPTSGLDPAARRSFWETLARLRKTEGTTMVAATHLMEEAERCDRVAIIDAGRIVDAGTPSSLRARLGGISIWLDSRQPAALHDRIQSHFGLQGRIVGGTLQLEHEASYELLPRLHESLGDLIEAATIRRPTLEDVFLFLTGRSIEGDANESSVTPTAPLRPAVNRA